MCSPIRMVLGFVMTCNDRTKKGFNLVVVKAYTVDHCGFMDRRVRHNWSKSSYQLLSGTCQKVWIPTDADISLSLYLTYLKNRMTSKVSHLMLFCLSPFIFIFSRYQQLFGKVQTTTEEEQALLINPGFRQGVNNFPSASCSGSWIFWLLSFISLQLPRQKTSTHNICC